MIAPVKLCSENSHAGSYSYELSSWITINQAKTVNSHALEDRMDSLEYKIFGVGFSTLNELNRRANADPYKSFLEHERTVGGSTIVQQRDGRSCIWEYMLSERWHLCEKREGYELRDF
ncbi:hypothetical protein V1478_017841 [Vespula squamosa]|uniref:Uncharacterized protein n=1 Tax=Vespula squamosa TaxID=30214 RepID=A0ABD1ZVC4_VESSQ